MNKDAIMNILPHRDAMLLLDTAQQLSDGSAEGTYTVRGDEWFLQGHFPGNPVVPGVVLCEIIGQSACVLFEKEMAGKTPYYAGMNKVRFRRMVKPGDTLITHVSLIRSKMNIYVIQGEARVQGDLCVSGEFTFAIAQEDA